jgi:AcrR family transcriptional regulator
MQHITGAGVPAKRTYRKRARAAGEERTRRAIAAAAVEVFSSTDFDDVTVTSLADRSGVSVPTLLRIHGSKADLFLVAVRSFVASLMDRRDAAADDQDAAIRQLLDDYDAWGDEHHRLFVRGPLLPELLDLAEQMRLRHRAWVRSIFDRRLTDELQVAVLVVALDIGTYRRLRAEGLSRDDAEHAIKAMCGWALQ